MSIQKTSLLSLLLIALSANALGADEVPAIKTDSTAPAPVSAQRTPPKPAKFADAVQLVPPEYPAYAKRASLQGKVTVRVLVDASGKPRKTQVIKREPIHLDVFDESARIAVMKSHYSPATDADGRPMTSWLSVPFNFVLEGTESAACMVQAAPEYPAEAREQGLEGAVVVWATIDEAGSPVESTLTVVDRFPKRAQFLDRKAKDAVMKSSCKPAKIGGRPTTGWAALRIEFKLEVE